VHDNGLDALVAEHGARPPARKLLDAAVFALRVPVAEVDKSKQAVLRSLAGGCNTDILAVSVVPGIHGMQDLGQFIAVDRFFGRRLDGSRPGVAVDGNKDVPGRFLATDLENIKPGEFEERGKEPAAIVVDGGASLG